MPSQRYRGQAAAWHITGYSLQITSGLTLAPSSLDQARNEPIPFLHLSLSSRCYSSTTIIIWGPSQRHASLELQSERTTTGLCATNPSGACLPDESGRLVSLWNVATKKKTDKLLHSVVDILADLVRNGPRSKHHPERSDAGLSSCLGVAGSSYALTPFPSPRSFLRASLSLSAPFAVS